MKNFMINLLVDKEKCIGCKLCAKACPVNAIEIIDKKAFINNEKCISCGKCDIVCPVDAINFPSDVDKVRKFLEQKEKIFLLIAPSFVVHYGTQIPDLLMDWRSCGFENIAEITYGAKLVTQRYQELIKEKKEAKYITSTCPVTFDYIFKYEEHNSSFIAPIVSPMVAMGMATKKYFPEHKTVFIGPCPAKIVEGREYKAIDAVLTFLEFDKLLKKFRGSASVQRSEQTESFDNFYNNRNKIYPRSGGLSKIMTEHNVLHAKQYIVRDGVLSIHELFAKEIPLEIVFFDILFCPGGCIGGPGLKSVLTTQEKMHFVDEYRTKTEESDKKLIQKFNFDLVDDFDLTPCFIKKVE